MRKRQILINQEHNVCFTSERGKNIVSVQLVDKKFKKNKYEHLFKLYFVMHLPEQLTAWNKQNEQIGMTPQLEIIDCRYFDTISKKKVRYKSINKRENIETSNIYPFLTSGLNHGQPNTNKTPFLKLKITM